MASTSLRMTQIEEQHRLQQFLGNIMMGPRSAPRDHSLTIKMLKLSIPLVMQTVPRKALHDSLDRMATILIYNFHYIHHKDGRVSLEVMGWAIEVSLMVVMVIARRSQTCFVLAEFLSSLYYSRYEMRDTLLDLEISTFWLKVALSLYRGLAVGDNLPVDELSQLETEQAVLCSTAARDCLGASKVVLFASAADQSNSYGKSGLRRHRACLEDSHRIHGILSKTRSYRYNTTSDLMELQGAIRHMRDSLKRLDNVVYIVDLAELLSRRAIRCGIVGDLKLAISIASLGLSHCPRSSKYYASCAATVADMYYDIFQVTCGFRLAKHAPKHLWGPEEHDELCLVAISPVKDLMVLGKYLDSKDSSDDEVLPDRIGSRGQSSEPVQWSGTEWKVLQRAVVIYGLAIKLATTDSEKQKYQAKLAEVLLHRFGHLESEDDLSEAAKLLLGLVDARTGSENAQGKVFERFFKTARVLGLQYDIFGDVEALQSSISLLRRSLKMATKASDIIQAILYLSAVLSSHFRLFQNSKYQKESIDLLYSALDQTPQSVDQRWSIRARLAVALYHRCLNTDDLNGVASSLREAWETYVVNLNHSQQKEVEWMIWHIGAQAYAYYDPAKCGAYHDDFSIVEMARPLEEPGDTVPLCGPVYPFANAWRRFENVGSLGGASQDLDNAIQFGTEALQIIPKDHPHRPRLLHQLATFHADSFRTYRSSNSILGYDERKALEFLDEAENTSSISHDRICVRRSKMKLLGQMGRWNDAVIVAEAAIEHISVLARENVQFKDRLRKLRSVHGLAADACYLSVRAERTPFQSLRLLEMGRGLHLSVIMTHHGVAPKDSACGKLDSMTGRTSSQCSSLKDQHEREVKAGHDDPLLGTHQSGVGASPVLGLPSEYMKTLKKPEDLKTIAGSGVIIIVNVPKIGDQSTAFVVDHAAIQCCELPEFTRRKVWHWARFMTGELREKMESEPGIMNRQLWELLTWLWISLVEPLFRTSVFERKFRSQALPRVWWIASGPVSYLPLHAARLSDGNPSCDALDRLVSSYVPTIKALAVLRKRELKISKPQMSKLLFIGMPRTPGSRDITGITQEIEAVKQVDPLRLTVEVRHAPTRESLLGDIATFNIVHCACHGHSSSEDPLKSGLRIFAAGKSGHKTEATASLTVEDLMLLQGKKCDLAFLSACNTADNPDTFLADECIHIASAFQIAGFSHVVSTMWPCSDHGCVAIVKSFYANLFSSQQVYQGHDTISRSVHDAVKSLRDDFPKQPLLWATFVHYGP